MATVTSWQERKGRQVGKVFSPENAPVQIGNEDDERPSNAVRFSKREEPVSKTNG